MPTTKRRIAVNLSDIEYLDLAALADKHDVAMAWLGRQAILEFVDRHRAEQLPLPMRLPSPRSHTDRELRSLSDGVATGQPL